MFLNVFCHIRAASLQASRTVLFGSSSGSTRINQTLGVGLLFAFFEVIHHNIHRIFVLEVQGQHFHRLYTPLHSAATGFETAEHWASSMQKHGLFCHISIPEAEPPLYQHTLWHSSAREGTASEQETFPHTHRCRTEAGLQARLLSPAFPSFRAAALSLK